MKTIKNKQILVGADFAGFPLKEAVCEHLKAKGWEITDVWNCQYLSSHKTHKIFDIFLDFQSQRFRAHTE